MTMDFLIPSRATKHKMGRVIVALYFYVWRRIFRCGGVDNRAGHVDGNIYGGRFEGHHFLRFYLFFP